MRYTLLIKKQAKKALKGEPYYRLRVGQWRIIFDKDDEVKIIAIEKIKPRGGAYK